MTEESELNSRAVEIIEWSRRKLAAKLPEFLPAIYLLPLKRSGEERSLWTDGETLFYHPETVVRDYLERKDAIAAQIMHITAHGLLGHIPGRQGQNPQLFDAVADAMGVHNPPSTVAGSQRRAAAALRRFFTQRAWPSVPAWPQGSDSPAAPGRPARPSARRRPQAAPMRRDPEARWAARQDRRCRCSRAACSAR